MVEKQQMILKNLVPIIFTQTSVERNGHSASKVNVSGTILVNFSDTTFRGFL